MNSTKKQKSKNSRLRSIQYKFSGVDFKPINEFGGCLHGSSQNTNPKLARPISTKHALHIVLRSEIAQGEFSLLNFRKAIIRIIDSKAFQFHIKIYEYAIVGNHIHLLIYLKTNHHKTGRHHLANFLRSISGLIARKVLGAEKNSAVLNPSWRQKFWTHRPYTRIVKGFKRGYQIAKDYVIQNYLESMGVIDYRTRNHNHKSRSQKVIQISRYRPPK